MLGLNALKHDTFESEIVQKGRLLPGIHGLRGLAAVAVVLFHLVHLTDIATPALFKFIDRDFGYGAQLFFALSAFSLMYSTERTIQRPAWVGEYLVKRFFRIAPLFYCLIALQLVAVHTPMDVRMVLLDLTFTFGFVPNSGTVWGGWTIGIEMIFYAVFPVLLLAVQNSRQALLLLIVSILVSYSARYQLNVEFLQTMPRPQWNWSYFAFISNLHFFIAGLYAYHLSKELSKDGIQLRYLAPWAALGILGVLLLSEIDAPYKGGGRPDLIVWALGFTALILWQSVHPSKWIANRVTEYLGERSFSIYLLHPLVIWVLKPNLTNIYSQLVPHVGQYAFFACALLVIGLVLMASELSYRFVEVPGIKLGRMYIRKREAARLAQLDKPTLHKRETSFAESIKP